MLHFSNFSLIVTISIILFTSYSTCGQTFDPNMSDKEYLDAIQNRLKQESLSAHLVVVNQSKILQQLTRSFIERKLKENLFKVVRQQVEVELEEMTRRNFSLTSSTVPSRLSRQDDNEDDDDATTGSTTPRPRAGLLPQLSNIVSTFFGSDVNVTGYLKDATSFLPGDISDRIISAASLIDPARFTSTTQQPTPGPLIINGQIIPQSAFVNGSYTYSFPSGVQSAVIVQPSAGFIPQGTLKPIIFNQSFPQTQVASPQSVSQSNANFGGGQLSLGQQQTGNIQQNAGNFQQQPGTFQQQNGNFQQQNGNFQQQNGNFQQQSGNFQQQNGNSQQQPDTFQQQSGNFQQQPGTFQQQNGNFQQQNGNFQQQPGSFQQQPGSFQQQNGNSQQQNGNSQQQNGNFQPQPGSFLQEQQQLEFNLNNGINRVVNSAQNNVGNNAGINANKPALNFKVNEAFLPTQAAVVPPQSSNEDEDEEGNNNEESSEDDFEPFGRDDQSSGGYIDEFPAVKYVVNIFKRLTNRVSVPTTTEFMNTTVTVLDYLDEEEPPAKQEATSPKPSTVMQIIEGGMSLYEGAKEAYQLLQRLNKFLDRVGDRVEDLGYGPEDVGIEL